MGVLDKLRLDGRVAVVTGAERYLPGKRLARPEEIAGIAVYLASDAAEYLTGQVVWIEGGALSHV